MPSIMRGDRRSALLIACCLMAAAAQAREWTSADGHSVQAEMLGIELGKIVLQLPDKRRAVLPPDQLSATDRAWVQDWAKDKSPTAILPPPVWPETIQQREIHVQPLARGDRGWIFKSPRYDFTCDAEVSTSVMNDFATVAEGCSLLMESLPIHFPKAEGKTFYARIFQNREGYARAGGPPGSGGVFITADINGGGVLLVPFESLGIEQFAGRNTKSFDYKATVLIHEMVHQATAELLVLMPKWASEGLAEYGANITYRNGVFYLGERDRQQSLRRRLEHYHQLTRADQAKGGGAALPKSWIMLPSQLMAKNETAWSTAVGGRSAQIELHRMYLSSMFLMYYFMHIADHGEARRLRAYFDEIADVSRFLRSDGREGKLPADLMKNGPRLTLEGIRRYFASHLLQPDGAAAVDRDFVQRFTAMGIRLSE